MFWFQIRHVVKELRPKNPQLSHSQNWIVSKSYQKCRDIFISDWSFLQIHHRVQQFFNNLLFKLDTFWEECLFENLWNIDFVFLTFFLKFEVCWNLCSPLLRISSNFHSLAPSQQFLFQSQIYLENWDNSPLLADPLWFVCKWIPYQNKVCSKLCK